MSAIDHISFSPVAGYKEINARLDMVKVAEDLENEYSSHQDVGTCIDSVDDDDSADLLNDTIPYEAEEPERTVLPRLTLPSENKAISVVNIDNIVDDDKIKQSKVPVVLYNPEGYMVFYTRSPKRKPIASVCPNAPMKRKKACGRYSKCACDNYCGGCAKCSELTRELPF